MKKLLCFLGGALLLSNVHAQKTEIKPYFVSDRVANLPLNNLINYKDTVAAFSSFAGKLIILDFWDLHCGSCINMFPTEDSIQRQFKNDVQFILVTPDDNNKVKAFLQRWDSTQVNELSIPIVTQDKLLSQLFRHWYIPHYVWIEPTGKILAQTSLSMIDSQTVSAAIQWMKNDMAKLRSYNYPTSELTFKRLSEEMSELFNHYKKSKTAVIKE